MSPHPWHTDSPTQQELSSAKTLKEYMDFFPQVSETDFMTIVGSQLYKLHTWQRYSTADKERDVMLAAFELPFLRRLCSSSATASVSTWS